MTSLARDTRREQPGLPDIPATAPGAGEAGVVRIPRIGIEAFCETPAIGEVLEAAGRDRRMARANFTVHHGGIRAALERYREAPTPGLIVLECRAEAGPLLAELDALAEVCDPDCKVIVIGKTNDITLYRELIARGISEYLHGPVGPMAVISVIATLFSDPEARKLGRVYAFLGARGGVGSSSVAQNVAWTLGRYSGGDVVLADLDLAFGTASLNFNLEPESGMADALHDTARLDDQMLERLLVDCDDHLRLLAAPALLDAGQNVEAPAVEAVIELARSLAPHLVLDLPHHWASWSRAVVQSADEVVITAVPDLASLRNAKHLVDVLRQARPNDPAPRLVLNQVGMPERPEIKSDAFAEAVGLEPAVSFPFDAKTYVDAANRGHMIADAAPCSKDAMAFRKLAESLSDRSLKRPRRFAWLDRLFRRRAKAARKA